MSKVDFATETLKSAGNVDKNTAITLLKAALDTKYGVEHSKGNISIYWSKAVERIAAAEKTTSALKTITETPAEVTPLKPVKPMEMKTVAKKVITEQPLPKGPIITPLDEAIKKANLAIVPKFLLKD